MADEQPTNEDGEYLLVGRSGAKFLAWGFHVWKHNERKTFYILNDSDGYLDFDKVVAWALIPEFEEVSNGRVRK